LISDEKGTSNGEKFIGSFSLNLIMPLTKLRENSAPIKIEQCSLNKFCPTLPEMENHGLLAELNRRNELSTTNEYTLEMRRNGTIYIKEMHCHACGSRLV
jgi:hypothetical protein